MTNTEIKKTIGKKREKEKVKGIGSYEKERERENACSVIKREKTHQIEARYYEMQREK